MARLVGLLLVLSATAVVVAVVALVPGPQNRPPAGATDLPDPAPGSEIANVHAVVDGDTITVRIEGRLERVRYVGIDAPEMGRPSDGIAAECGAVEATEANRELVAGRSLALEQDVSDRDRFGRLLRHAWVATEDGWRHVGEVLTATGHVEARSFPPDTGRDEQLAAAEARARQSGLGIWGSC